MNNEEKEHLKEFMGELLDGFLHDWGYLDIEHAEVSNEYNTLLCLIDSQPTEEEAKEAWDVLQRGLSRCESMNEKACARCSKFKGCQEGEETIRKALGVEEFGE